MDIVVVCKIDRLTRSLTDFSRMIEVFERHGVSFVSVTQQFNTTTSCERVSVNSHAPAKMLVRPGGGQSWLWPMGPWRRVKGRWKPVVSGLRVAGSRGFRGRVVDETGSSRVDNHKIR